MSDQKVISLRGTLPSEAQREANSDVVKALEEILQLARNGQLRAFAMAYLKLPDIIVTNWQIGDANGHMMIAGVKYLEHRLMQDAFGLNSGAEQVEP